MVTKKKKYDAVCGLEITGCTGLKSVNYKGKKYDFCDPDCYQRFKKNPKRYVEGKPLIKLKNVKKSFMLGKVKTEVLRGIDFNIWEGDFVVIIGPSGSGKSTTLNMLGLLDRPTSGEIYFGSKNVAHLKDIERAQLRSKTFGFVFQQYNLIPWLSALENVTMPLIFAGKEAKNHSIQKRFKEIGLEHRMNHKPATLSGGEQQRVAMLRALSNRPKILLADEPTGNLDSKTGKKILDMLYRLNKKEGKTLIIVTHDATIAKEADQILSIQDGVIIRDHHHLRKKYTDKMINHA